MRVNKSIQALFCLIIFFSNCAYSQKDSFTVVNDTTYTLVGDTLFTNQGFKIYKGLKVKIGKASGKNGWYASIGFKSAAAAPVLLFRQSEIQNNYKYQENEQIRTNDKVKVSLHEGDIYTIYKIRQKGNCKKSCWFLVYIKDESEKFSLKFSCEIGKAMKTKELILVND